MCGEMDVKPSDVAVESGAQTGCLLDHVFLYITSKSYPDGCTREKKRTIRRKAERFVIRDGQFFYIKNMGRKVLKSILGDDVGFNHHHCILIIMFDMHSHLKKFALADAHFGIVW